MANQRSRNKIPYANILIEQIWHQCFQVFQCESVADKDEETVPGQIDMLILKLPCMCFLIDVRL